jgi:hypothetical protein
LRHCATGGDEQSYYSGNFHATLLPTAKSRGAYQNFFKINCNCLFAFAASDGNKHASALGEGAAVQFRARRQRPMSQWMIKNL